MLPPSPPPPPPSPFLHPQLPTALTQTLPLLWANSTQVCFTHPEMSRNKSLCLIFILPYLATCLFLLNDHYAVCPSNPEPASASQVFKDNECQFVIFLCLLSCQHSWLRTFSVLQYLFSCLVFSLDFPWVSVQQTTTTQWQNNHWVGYFLLPLSFLSHGLPLDDMFIPVWLVNSLKL